MSLIVMLASKRNKLEGIVRKKKFGVEVRKMIDCFGEVELGDPIKGMWGLGHQIHREYELSTSWSMDSEVWECSHRKEGLRWRYGEGKGEEFSHEHFPHF